MARPLFALHAISPVGTAARRCRRLSRTSSRTAERSSCCALLARGCILSTSTLPWLPCECHPRHWSTRTCRSMPMVLCIHVGRCQACTAERIVAGFSRSIARCTLKCSHRRHINFSHQNGHRCKLCVQTHNSPSFTKRLHKIVAQRKSIQFDNNFENIVLLKSWTQVMCGI